MTYRELQREVCRFANVLKSRRQDGRPGHVLHADDPRGAIAMLACARIGAAHSVIFGGFTPKALRDRMNDAGERGHHRRRRLAAARRAAEENVDERARRYRRWRR